MTLLNPEMTPHFSGFFCVFVTAQAYPVLGLQLSGWGLSSRFLMTSVVRGPDWPARY